jgi:hypothetical protein
MGRSARRRAANRARANSEITGASAARHGPVGLAAGDFDVVTLADLVDAVERRRQADLEIQVLVDVLVARGMNWGDVGRALGISRQGARQRYSQR